MTVKATFPDVPDTNTDARTAPGQFQRCPTAPDTCPDTCPWQLCEGERRFIVIIAVDCPGWISLLGCGESHMEVDRCHGREREKGDRKQGGWWGIPVVLTTTHRRFLRNRPAPSTRRWSHLPGKGECNWQSESYPN